MKKIVFFIIAIFSVTFLHAQTASVTIGCAPLEVDFTSPGLSSHFWSFGNGNNSELVNPSHNYINPGVFTVELFEGVGGTKVGEIIITVLSPPDINIGASEQMGCSPFLVEFTNESVVDPNTDITGFFWDFGDGGNSTLQNPTHIYTTEGTFSVSLRIESGLTGCTTTKSFPDFISVSGSIDAGLSVDNVVVCEAPATINITNNTVDMSGYTYSWDLGNGQTSTDYNPPAAVYDEEGTYTITMIVDNGDGCVVTLDRNILVGKPKIEFEFPDTVCINSPYFINNFTQANVYSWEFGSSAAPQTTNLRSPTVIFFEAGSQIVTFSAVASSACQADTFFTVFVEEPSAAFTIDPLSICTDPATYTFSHPDPNMTQYSWYILELDSAFTGGPDYNFTYDEPFRDSFYISRPDTFKVYLEITSPIGCQAIDSFEFIHRAPEAHFVPNTTRGCAPLTVNFDEVSLSTEEIVSWEWVFGDGDTNNTTTPDDMIHTYTDPGEYYVQLAIENEDGCRDTSAGVWIYVGELIDSDFTFDKTEICLYDTVSFEALNLDPRIDSYHFDTDDSRISDCYENPEATHAFTHAPGTYPVTLTIEYNGCFNDIDNGETITVNGSKSIIKYMTNCEDPYTVMFQDSSLNASTSIWYINGDVINMDTIAGDIFNYTFETTGDYQIKLWTDDDTMCDPDSSIIDVYIRDIQANFTIPEAVCAFTPIEIDASASVDVDNTCSKGYEWFGIANRPRLIDYPNVTAAYNPGPILIRLIVEDLNGCTDTLDRESEAYGVFADFEPDRTKLCYPSTMSFTDKTVSDTTIVSWDWSFGSSEQNPTDVNFTEENGPFLAVDLIVIDALGCTDTATVNIPTYEVSSNISIDPGTTVCIGDSINFTATDYTQDGSFLNFTWLFGDLPSVAEQNPSFQVTEAGSTPVTLIIEEDSTGCTNEYELNVNGIVPPDAAFTIDVDNPDRICPDEIVLFQNQSTLDGPGGFLWNFGNGSTAFVENPSTFFDVGTYDITLTVSSIYGCSDMFTQQVTLEGPEGDFTLDRDVLCIGDTVTYTLIDTSSISSFEWDFGDGQTSTNNNPVSHPYTFLPDTLAGTITASLILESENGCTRTVAKSIVLADLDAGFEILMDTSLICNREVQFIDTTRGGDSFVWDFGNGETSTDSEPVVTYNDAGTYIVSLSVQAAGGVCEAVVKDTIVITGLNKAKTPTVFSPNGDDVNDYFDIIIPEDQRGCVEVIRSKIFNRWGNLIYDNNLPPEGWDGRYEGGDEAPAEIYTYILEVRYISGEEETFKGTFTLIR